MVSVSPRVQKQKRIRWDAWRKPRNGVTNVSPCDAYDLDLIAFNRDGFIAFLCAAPIDTVRLLDVMRSGLRNAIRKDDVRRLRQLAKRCKVAIDDDLRIELDGRR